MAAVAYPSVRAFAIGRFARPYQHLHAERLAVAGDDRTDATIAIDTKRLAAQALANADLPFAGFIAATCCGIARIPASTSPQVNSAVA